MSLGVDVSSGEAEAAIRKLSTGMLLQLQLRADVVVSQALPALVTSFTFELHRAVRGHAVCLVRSGIFLQLLEPLAVPFCVFALLQLCCLLANQAKPLQHAHLHRRRKLRSCGRHMLDQWSAVGFLVQLESLLSTGVLAYAPLRFRQHHQPT